MKSQEEIDGTEKKQINVVKIKSIAGTIKELSQISDKFLVNKIYAKCAGCKIEISESIKILNAPDMVLIGNNEYEKLKRLLCEAPLKGMFAIHVINYNFNIVFFFKKVTPIASIEINSGIASDYSGVYTEYTLGATKKIYNDRDYEIIKPFLTNGLHCQEKDVFEFLKSIGISDIIYNGKPDTLYTPDTITLSEKRSIINSIMNMVQEFNQKI